MKLRTKFIMGFSSMVILLLTAGTIAYLAVNRVSKSAEIYEKNTLCLDLVSRLQLAIRGALMLPNDYLIHGGKGERQNFLVYAAQVEKMIEALPRLCQLDEEDLRLINETAVSFAMLKDVAENIFKETTSSENVSMIMEKMDAIGEDTIKKIDLLNQRSYTKVVKTAHQERLYRKHTNLILLICAVAFLVDAVVFSLFIWRSISKPLYLLQKGIRTITGGRLNHRVSVPVRGEFKEFADSFNNMVERLQGSFSDLEEEKDKLQSILLNIVDGVVVADANYNLLFMNPMAETILGKQFGELKGKGFLGCHDENSHLIQMLKNEQLPITKKINYDEHVLDVNAAAIKKSDKTKIGYLMVVRDITDQEKAREKLEELAITDSLTKLYNRGYFQHSLDYEFSKAKRYNLPLSLIMIDIDNFKSYNDRYGHQMGDIVLITLAKLIKNTVRKIDIAARYGGEEFIVILPHTGAKESQLLAERLRKNTETQMVKHMLGHPVNVTISIGVATLTAADGLYSKEDLVKHADEAMYTAKHKGRNRVEVFA